MVDRVYDVEVAVDRFVERRVEVPYKTIVEVPQVKQIKKSITVPKYVEKLIEVERIQEVPVKRVEYVEVNVPQYVDRIVERPVYREVEVPRYVDRIVEMSEDVYVDRIVDVNKY